MCNRIKNLLIIRFSALGDVAMTVPVIDSLARQYPDMHITVLSRQMTKPLFSYMPPNVTFWGIDLKNSYKGIGGLNTLFREIKEKRFDAVADFHNVLRTIYLRTRCVLSGIRVAHINKGKAIGNLFGRARLTRTYNNRKRTEINLSVNRNIYYTDTTCYFIHRLHTRGIFK